MATSDLSEVAIFVITIDHTMKSTTIGTCHFVSIYDAYRFYCAFDCDHAEVDRKRHEGEIELSLPPPVDGAVITEKNGRYFYVFNASPP